MEDQANRLCQAQSIWGASEHLRRKTNSLYNIPRATVDGRHLREQGKRRVKCACGRIMANSIRDLGDQCQGSCSVRNPAAMFFSDLTTTHLPTNSCNNDYTRLAKNISLLGLHFCVRCSIDTTQWCWTSSGLAAVAQPLLKV